VFGSHCDSVVEAENGTKDLFSVFFSAEYV